MTDANNPVVAHHPEAAVVLLGTMGGGRPHAARFSAEDAGLATKAAGLMGLSLLPLTSPDRVEAAQGLPAGRIFATGRGFVPFCSQKAFVRLCELGGIDPALRLQPPAASAGAEPGQGTEPTPLPATRLPLGWGDLGPGCLCLASEGEGHGWYEAVVTGVVADGLLVAWRDFDPQEHPPLTRRADQLGLLPPGTGARHDGGGSEATA